LPPLQKSQGCIPFESTNLQSGVWTVVSDYSLPARPRHGTVLPITAKESEAIQHKWGSDYYHFSADPSGSIKLFSLTNDYCQKVIFFARKK
jgi:hypothetical protein